MDFKADIFDQYTPEARRSVFFARATARQLGADTVESVHLLLGIVREDIALLNRFLSAPVSASTFQMEITNGVPKSGAARQQTTDVPFGNESRRIFSLAAEEAAGMSQRSVGIEHLFLGLLNEESSIGARVLRERGVDILRVRSELAVRPHSPPAAQDRVRRQVEKLRKIIADSPDLDPDRPRETIFQRYTVRADRLIFFARHFAGYLGSPVVESEHIFLSIVREGRDHFELFFPLAHSKDTVYKELEAHFTPGGTIDLSGKIVPTEKLPPFSEHCRRVLSDADEEAAMLGSEQVAPEHLLLGMLRDKDSYVAAVLREYGAEPERIRKGLTG
jgi:ATP-dependent Clp protease ATP-binding subunit ClpA